MVFSHIRYCMQVYGGSSNFDKIQKVFNFAARVIGRRRKYDHISGLLEQYEWLSAEQCVQYFELCTLHRIITTGEPTILSRQFVLNRDVVRRHTRQSDQMVLPRPRTNHGKRCFIYRSYSLFNKYFASSQTSFLSVTTNVAKKLTREVITEPNTLD